MRTKSPRAVPTWPQLLVEAVTKPGTISAAYTQFWNYSVGNQLLAWFECLRRGIQPGPIHTFAGWLKLGRHVKKGEMAITLCMPVQVKSRNRSANERDTERADDDPAAKKAAVKTVFVYRPRWFVLSQTDGDPYIPTEMPEWSEARALKALSIERIDFTHTDGNCQGFARERKVAISPIAASPHETLFHELAHVILGHTAEGPLEDHEHTLRSLKEVEAEAATLICCESLGLPGASDCRGYIQHWLAGSTIPEASVQKIFKAADALLKAGYPSHETHSLTAADISSSA